jgi:hypothetical protein
MAAVLSQPTAGSLLGRRRVSNPQYSPSMVSYMPNYDMNLKNPMAHQQQSQLPMSTSHFIPIQTGPEMDAMMDINAYSQPSMVTNAMAYHHTMPMDHSFTNYNMANTFNAGMPVMPLEPMPQWQTYDHISMQQQPINLSHMRSESQSSIESCPPLIKSEDEQSPILPSQVFFNTPAYSSMQADNSSSAGSDDIPTTASSTDIDALMKAIQSKVSNGSEQTSKPMPRELQQVEASHLSPERDINVRCLTATSHFTKRHISRSTHGHILASSLSYAKSLVVVSVSRSSETSRHMSVVTLANVRIAVSSAARRLLSAAM